MSKNINLLYAWPSTDIFSLMSTAKVSGYDWNATFNEKDEVEIGRYSSYAFFPELRTMVDSGEKITTAKFKECLSNQGIKNIVLQNRILHAVIQNRAGLQFMLGGFVPAYLQSQNISISETKPPVIEAEVINSDKVLIKFNCDYSEPGSPTACISTSFSFSITSKDIKINSYDIRQQEDTPLAKSIFKILQKSNASLLGSLLIFIKRLFGYDSELSLDLGNIENNTVPKKSIQ